MSSGTNRLNYQIYRNAVRNAIWGTGADAHGVVLIGTQSGTVTVYGRIPASQIVAGRHLHRHRQHHADLLSRRPMHARLAPVP